MPLASKIKGKVDSGRGGEYFFFFHATTIKHRRSNIYSLHQGVQWGLDHRGRIG